MTSRRLEYLGLLLVLMAAVVLADAGPDTKRIDVFLTRTNNVTGLEQLRRQWPNSTVRVHAIDGIADIKTKLSQGLPGDTQQARRTALKNLQRLGTAEREQLQQSADALVLAWQYEVRRHPAIVFDQRYVVYGVTDLRKAYVLYRKWHEAKGS